MGHSIGVAMDGEEKMVQWQLWTLKFAVTVGQAEGRITNRPF